MTVVEAWRELGLAVREASHVGAEFRVIGADVQVSGNLPDFVRDKLDPDLLRAYFGAEAADIEALDFLVKLNVEAVLVRDREGAIFAVKELSGAAHVGIDIETAVPGYRPPAIRLNLDGSVSSSQEKAEPGALDARRADIVTLQLYAGGKKCFVFTGEALRLLLQSKWLREQHLVAHNAGFELSFLRKHPAPDAQPAKVWPLECTLQASGLLHGVYRRSLADTSKIELGLKPPKALQTSCFGAAQLSPGQVAYAANDAILAWRLWPKLNAELCNKRRMAAYMLQRDAIPAVADMEARGLGFDLKEHARQCEVWSRGLATARLQYLETAGKPAPSTPAELRDWVHEVAGDLLAKWPRTETGQLSTKRSHLKKLALSDVPTARPLLEILAKEKLLASFGPKLASFVASDGRIHADYNLAGSKTGRFSCSKPNMQQLPSARAPDFRGCITAEPGMVLIGCDWNQIEMRAAAHISRDPALTRVYAEQRDLHSETAARIASIPVERVTKDQRNAAKAVNFGSIYGIGPRMLVEDCFDSYGIMMTEVEAKRALDRFFETYFMLQEWRWDHHRRCKALGIVRIGCGRVVEADWEPYGLNFPQHCNLPIQGICADAMLRAITLVFRRLRDLRAGLVASVHDELLIEAAECNADKARTVLEETMVEAFEATFPGAPTTGVINSGIGVNWLEAKG